MPRWRSCWSWSDALRPLPLRIGLGALKDKRKKWPVGPKRTPRHSKVFSGKRERPLRSERTRFVKRRILSVFHEYRRFEKALYFGFHLGYTVGVSLSLALDLSTGRSNITSLALDLPTGRSNTGRSRSGCRVQRRISDLKGQIAKRRGGRRPAYGAAGRQGGRSSPVTGRARFSCRIQRRISDLKGQIAKRRGGRRPANGAAGRQGGRSSPDTGRTRFSCRIQRRISAEVCHQADSEQRDRYCGEEISAWLFTVRGGGI